MIIVRKYGDEGVMAMAKKKLPIIYHCDGFYFKDVCPARGAIDVADVRHDKEGFAKKPREICTTDGWSPFKKDEICSHCIENRKFFRKPRREISNAIRFGTSSR